VHWTASEATKEIAHCITSLTPEQASPEGGDAGVIAKT
jgi:hypothetical protein